MKTIKDFYSYCKKKNLKFFGTRAEEYMTNYNAKSNAYDLYINKTFGSMILNVSDDLSESEQIEEVQSMIDMAFIVNDFKFKKMLEIAQAEFNPIENYDRYEDTTNTFGSRNDTQSNGEIASSTTTPSITTTSTNSVTGYDSTAFSDREKDTSTVEGNTIVSTTLPSTNSFAKGEEEDTIVSHIHGNIGVTTSTQMLNEFYKYYNWFDFYKVVIDTIINEIALPIYFEIMDEYSQSSGSSADIEKLKQDIVIINQKIVAFTERVESDEASIGNLEGYVDDIVQDMNTQFTQVNGNVTALTTRVTTAEGVIEQHTTSIGALNGTVAQHTADISALDTRVEVAEDDIGNLEDSVSQLNSDLSALKTSDVAGGNNIWKDTTLIDVKNNSGASRKGYAIKLDKTTTYYVGCSSISTTLYFGIADTITGTPTAISEIDNTTKSASFNGVKDKYLIMWYPSGVSSVTITDCYVSTVNTYEPYIPSVKTLSEETTQIKDSLSGSHTLTTPTNLDTSVATIVDGGYSFVGKMCFVTMKITMLQSGLHTIASGFPVPLNSYNSASLVNWSDDTHTTEYALINKQGQLLVRVPTANKTYYLSTCYLIP